MTWPSALTLAGLLRRGVSLTLRFKGRPQHGRANKQPPAAMPFEKHRANQSEKSERPGSVSGPLENSRKEK